MALSLNDEHVALAESVRELARRRAPIEMLRGVEARDEMYDTTAVWKDVTAQGLTTLHLPERLGGSGVSIADSAVAAFVVGQTLLPTSVVATMVAAVLAERLGAEDLCRRLSEGGKAAVVTLLTKNHGDHLSGTSEPVAGAAEADILLVLTRDNDMPEDSPWSCAIVEATAAGVRCHQPPSADLTSAVASFDFDHVPMRKLGEVSDGLLLAAIGALHGAEIAGAARWALDTAVAYARTRQQFGVPIGSFQAVKHKLARMAAVAELAAAAAWGSAESLAQDETQQMLAGGSAVLVALRRGPWLLTEAVTVFGGIGFTWEHDVHLYLRRTLALAGRCGPRGVVERKVAVAGLSAERKMEIDLPDADPAYRDEVAELIERAAVMPPDTPRPQGPDNLAYAVGERRSFLASHGLVTPHWPEPWGRSASATEQIVIAQEFVRRGLTPPTTVIGEWAMPTVFSHGTPEQQKRLAGPTTTGEIVWCQLFSEPGAGSDLAALRTRADKVEGGWKLTGQKVWTSTAAQADWAICLARTDPHAPKHKGLSFFLVDMSSPGLTVRPIRQATGVSEFNEVFIDGVFVPDDCLVGAPGEGWRIAMTTLANERTAMGSVMSSGAEDCLRDMIRGRDEPSEDELRALGGILATSTAIGSLTVAETIRRINGLEPGPGSSLGKVATAELYRAAADAALDVTGPESALAESPAVMAELGAPAQLLGGGTVEIQLNVIAERILGLPR